MCVRSFRKKKRKKDNCEDKQNVCESTNKVINKLENYLEAPQLVHTMQSENRKLRLELEYLKHAASPSQTNLPTIVSGPTQETRRSFSQSQVTTEIQRDVHENCNLRLQEQQATITDLSARLKETEDKLRKKDAADQILYDAGHSLVSTLENRFEKMLFDTLERLGKKIDADNKRDESLKEKLDYAMKILTEQLKGAEESHERKQYSHLLMEMFCTVDEFKKRYLDVLEKVEVHFARDRIGNDRMKEIEMMKQQCKTLEQVLAREVKSHSHLWMRVHEINISSVLNKQDECARLVRSLLASTETTSSKLTELLTLAKEESKRSNENRNYLPAHILGFAYRIEKKFDDKDKVMKFGLALGLNSCTVQKIVNEENGKVFWEVLYEWNKTSVHR